MAKKINWQNRERQKIVGTNPPDTSAPVSDPYALNDTMIRIAQERNAIDPGKNSLLKRRFVFRVCMSARTVMSFIFIQQKAKEEMILNEKGEKWEQEIEDSPPPLTSTDHFSSK